MKVVFSLFNAFIFIHLLAPASHAMGIRHDVKVSEYISLAANKGKYAAGENYPDFSAVCAIVETIDNEPEVTGSGTLIGKRHIITAAHCVVDPDRGKSLIRNLSIRFGSDAYKGFRSYKIKQIHLPKTLKSGFFIPFGELNDRYSDDQATNESDRTKQQKSL